MSELVEELDKLKNDFYGRMSDVVKNKKDVSFNYILDKISFSRVSYLIDELLGHDWGQNK